MSKTYVLYHGGCYDGFASAWIARKHLPEDTEFIPVGFSSPMPEIEDGSGVYILDFSYPRDELIALQERTQVLVLDHHKTAEAQLKGLSYAVFDLGKSGATLTWEWFNGLCSMPPEFIRYIEDRDLWRHALKNSREINAVIRSYPFDFEVWDRSVSNVCGEAVWVSEGRAILRAQQREIEFMTYKVQYASFGGYVFPCINANCSFQSDIAHYLYENFPTYRQDTEGWLRKTDVRGSAVYSVWPHGDNGQVKFFWSLRSNGSLDVSELATAFGGGGLPQASGFREESACAQERFVNRDLIEAIERG